jgi:hypothetical protein
LCQSAGAIVVAQARLWWAQRAIMADAGAAARGRTVSARRLVPPAVAGTYSADALSAPILDLEMTMRSHILLAVLAAALVGACAAPIPPRFSDPPREAAPQSSVNQPSTVESTSAEYDTPSSSTGSSTR